MEGDGSFAPGERGTVDITFRNLGTARASAFDYHLYLSTDPTITSSDTRLPLHGFGSGRVSFGLGAGDTDEERRVGFTVPSDLGAGSYYLGVVADAGDAVSESDESNNTRSARVAVTGAYPPEPASDLGDLTALSGPRTRWGSVNRAGDAPRLLPLHPGRKRTGCASSCASSVRTRTCTCSTAPDGSSTRPTHAAAENDSVERTLDTGTYYVRVDAYAGGGIVYQLRYSRVTFEFPPEPVTDLGNLTALADSRTRSGSVNSSFDAHDYYRFTLDGTHRMRFELRELGADADLYLLDSSGQELASSGYSRHRDRFHRGFAPRRYLLPPRRCVRQRQHRLPAPIWPSDPTPTVRPGGCAARCGR